MLYIKSISAKNLCSFKKIELSLENKKAYSINGSNGSGKSSIFEIVVWTLFKKSTKKTIKGDWGKTNGTSKITLSDGTSDFTIERNTETPTTILLNGDVITQEHLESFIGSSFQVFMSSVMCNQKRVSSFVNEKTDTGRAKIFGEMLGCSILDKIRLKVQALKTNTEMKYNSKNSRIVALEEQLDILKLDFDGKTPKESSIKLKKDKANLLVLAENLKSTKLNFDVAYENDRSWSLYELRKEAIIRLKNEILKAKAELNKKKYEDSLVEIQNLKIKEDKAEEQLNKIKEESILMRVKYSSISEKIKALTDNIKSGKCPTCGTILSDKETLAKLKLDLSSAQEKLKVVFDKKDKLKIEEDKARKNLKLAKDTECFDETIQNFKSNQRFIKDGVEKFKREKELLKKPPFETRVEISTLQNNLNNQTEKLAEAKNDVKNLYTNLKSYIEAKNKLNIENDELKAFEEEYFVNKWLFDNLPLMKLKYINNNKLALEDSMNENISMMGIPFMIRIKTQKEVKTTKETKEAFNFEISNTLTDKKISKEDLSGGEEMIILLAAQMGINDISGVKLSFEIYDEIFGSLDDKNSQLVIDFLNIKAKDKQILTVSHKSEIANSFEGNVNVIKKGGYSYAK